MTVSFQVHTKKTEAHFLYLKRFKQWYFLVNSLRQLLNYFDFILTKNDNCKKETMTTWCANLLSTEINRVSATQMVKWMNHTRMYKTSLLIEHIVQINSPIFFLAINCMLLLATTYTRDTKRLKILMRHLKTIWLMCLFAMFLILFFHQANTVFCVCVSTVKQQHFRYRHSHRHQHRKRTESLCDSLTLKTATAKLKQTAQKMAFQLHDFTSIFPVLCKIALRCKY